MTLLIGPGVASRMPRVAHVSAPLLPLRSSADARPMSTSSKVAWPLIFFIRWAWVPLQRMPFQTASNMSPSGRRPHGLPRGYAGGFQFGDCSAFLSCWVAADMSFLTLDIAPWLSMPMWRACSSVNAPTTAAISARVEEDIWPGRVVHCCTPSGVALVRRI